MDVFHEAAEFNRKIIGIERPTAPTPLTRERRKAIADHLREEAQELEDAEDLADQVDALTDLIFISAGRFHETGTNGAEHYAETSYANRGRVRGDNPTKRPGSIGFDAIKPEGWVGPDHDAILNGVPASRRKPKPKVLILGSARHGKDTVAEMLRDQHGFRFSSSSMFCAERIMMPAFEMLRAEVGDESTPVYDSPEECYEDRVNWRKFWYDHIQAYNATDPSRLAREMLAAGNDMYVGMRSAMEFAEARKLFDVILWVDASGRGLPPEGRDSFDIDFDIHTMVEVDNSGTLEDTANRLDCLVSLGII